MKRRLWFSLVIFLALIPTVFAQTLESAFQTLENMGITGSFQAHPLIWDLIIVVWIFVMIGRQILGKFFNSVPVGGSIGAALALLTYGGLRVLDFSLVRDMGPWIAVFAIIALLVLAVRLLQGGQNGMSIGAIGIFLITTFLLSQQQIAVRLRELNSVFFGILNLVWILSGVFTIVWIFRHFTTGGNDPDGTGGGGALNSLGNWLGNTRDGLRHIANNRPFRRRPAEPVDLERLTRQVDDFNARASNLHRDVRLFETEIGNHPFDAADLSTALTNIYGLPDANAIRNRILTRIRGLNRTLSDLTTLFDQISRDAIFGQLPANTQTNFNDGSDHLLDAERELLRLLV